MPSKKLWEDHTGVELDEMSRRDPSRYDRIRRERQFRSEHGLLGLSQSDLVGRATRLYGHLPELTEYFALRALLMR
jgi:hypothetical protein